MALITLSKSNFEETINKDSVTIVDFWASWCGPCRMLAPELQAFAEENENVNVGKVNVDDEEEISVKYNIMTIPTLIVFKNGKVMDKHIGFIKKDEIKGLVSKNL